MNVTLRRAVIGATALLAVATAVPAEAGSSYLSRTTGRAAVTDWVQVLDMRSRGFGNVHVGFLNAFETAKGVADVFSVIEDYDCPEGEMPGGGGHGDPGGCVWVATRFLEGSGVRFTMDPKLSTAHLEGTLNASTGGHEGPGDALGTVGANFTWTGFGDAEKSTSTFRFRENGTSYTETYRSTRRAAAMSGVLGPMLFEQAVSATGSLSTFRATSHYREG